MDWIHLWNLNEFDWCWFVLTFDRNVLAGESLVLAELVNSGIKWLWHLEDMVKKFGAVYYNFPHAGVVQGFFDGHPFVRILAKNERRLCHIPRLGTDFPTIGPVVFLGVTIVAAAKNMLFSLFFKAALLQCVVIVGLLSFQCLMCRSTLALKVLSNSSSCVPQCSTVSECYIPIPRGFSLCDTTWFTPGMSWDIPRDPWASSEDGGTRIWCTCSFESWLLVPVLDRLVKQISLHLRSGASRFQSVPQKKRWLIRSLQDHWKTPLKILKTLEEPHGPMAKALRGFVKPDGLVKVSSNCCARGWDDSDAFDIFDRYIFLVEIVYILFTLDLYVQCVGVFLIWFSWHVPKIARNQKSAKIPLKRLFTSLGHAIERFCFGSVLFPGSRFHGPSCWAAWCNVEVPQKRIPAPTDK